MKYQVILLDIDNTLLDFNKAEVYALQRTFNKVGYPYSDRVKERYEYYNSRLWKSLEAGEIEIEELKKRRFKELIEELRINEDHRKMSELYMEYLAEADFEIEGAYEMCQTLSKSCTLAAMTNGISNVQKSRMKKSRLGQFLSAYFISEEIGLSKPHPGIFEYALDKLQINDKNKVLMIGDSLSSDMKGGISAGIDTCFYNPNGIIPNVQVTYNVSSLLEIPDRII